MKILFHMLPELGHLNPTFPLARTLADRGHEVLYTALVDLQPVIEARGFRSVPIHQELLPRGAFTVIEENPFAEERERAWGRIRDRVQAEYTAGTALEQLLRAINPDLLIADVVPLSPLQFAAHALAIPCLQVSTSLSQHQDELPPLISSLDADTPPLLLEAARWDSCCVRSFDPVPHTEIMTAVFDGYCARFSYPPQDLSVQSVFWPVLSQYPQAVLCEEAFDLPRSACGPIHIATPVDVQRDESLPAQITDFVGDCRSLIYASLGSLPGRYPHASTFFRELIEVMRNEPGWRAVLAIGPLSDCALTASLPDNVLLVRRAPQIWMLRRTAVFVTHAGLGSVREAIELAVPMVAVPQQHDQPGNATRIVHHGVGLAIPADAVTARGLRRAIATVYQRHDEFLANIRALSQKCRAEVASGRAVAAIEAAARRGSQRSLDRVPGMARSESSPNGWVFVGGVAGLVTLRREIAANRASDFLVCAELTEALAVAGGTLLARVEVEGTSRQGRCAWFMQADELLLEYAEWCAEQALEVAATADTHTTAAFREMLREMRNLREGGASFGEKQAHWARVFAASAQLWHEGHAAAGAACESPPVEAAYGAQTLALQALARREAGAAAGTKQGMDAYTRRYQVERARFGAELERRVAIRAREVGLEWECA